MGISFLTKVLGLSLPALAKIAETMFSDQFLVYTNIGLSTVLSGLGDIIEQKYEMLNNELPAWDKTRTRDMALTGTTVGVVNHYWYKVLDHFIPGSSVALVLQKILADQIIGSTLSISTFFGTLALLEGSTMDQFKNEFKSKAWKLFVAEWMIWPPIQFLNFHVISGKYRVLFDNFISLGYDIYTSRVKHHDSINLDCKSR